MHEGKKSNRNAKRRAVERKFKDGSIADEAERYVAVCREARESGGGKAGGFANLAGFCRWLRLSQGELREIGSQFPAVYDEILTIMEDEALCMVRGSSETARLVMAYLKRRLGYEEEGDGKRGEDALPLQVVFDHDIMEDGK